MAPKWGHHPVPKLIINEGEGAPSPSSQISALSGLAAAAVIAATNSDFLIRLATALKKDTAKGPLEVRIYDDKNILFYDLIELQDESEEAIRVHMIAAAIRAGAPIGDGEEIKDIAKDKKKISKTYRSKSTLRASTSRCTSPPSRPSPLHSKKRTAITTLS